MSEVSYNNKNTYVYLELFDSMENHSLNKYSTHVLCTVWALVLVLGTVLWQDQRRKLYWPPTISVIQPPPRSLLLG
jgi:hypothetical protein